jgi:predicted nucleic acid-binding protein
LTTPPEHGRVVLDSGGVSAIAEGNALARAVLVRARMEGRLVVIPAPVLTEVYTGRRDHAHIDRVVKAVDQLIATTPDRAKEAGVLRARSGVLDVVDAIVVAEAVSSLSAVIMTSDPDDIDALVEAAGASERITVIAV